MADLENFFTAITTVLARSDEYKLSGVSDITGLGMAIIFSASIYPSAENAIKPTPAEATKAFQKVSVDGFIFSKAEIINFRANTKMPGPPWRIQVKYFKEPNMGVLKIGS